MFLLLYTVGVTVALISALVTVTVGLVVATAFAAFLLFAWETK